MRFKDKIIVVIGGSSGIGKTTAERFVAEGAKVVIASKDKDKGQSITSAIGGESIFIKVDISKEDEVKSLFEEVVNKFGKLDILVNSAGVYSPNQGDITKLPTNEFDEMMSVNFRGIFLASKYALPHLSKAKGNIVNISSALGLVPEKESSIYCSSKAAVNMFTKATALNTVGDGVRVNAVCPGPIDTPMLSENIPDKDDMREYLDENPMKRAGTTDEVASLILFLASDEASYMTGGIHTVDGGESIK